MKSDVVLSVRMLMALRGDDPSRRCAVEGCQQAVWDCAPYPLCDTHESGLRIGEMIELCDKSRDPSCTIDGLEACLAGVVDLAKQRAAASGTN